MSEPKRGKAINLLTSIDDFPWMRIVYADEVEAVAAEPLMRGEERIYLKVNRPKTGVRNAAET